MSHREPGIHRIRGNLYSVTFSDIECSGVAERDVFDIQGSTETRLRLHQVELSQHSEVAGASEERLPVEILTGAVVASSGGTAGVPTRYLDRGATSLVSAAYNATTVAGAASDETLRWGGAWPINECFNYEPASDKRIQTGLNENLSVRIGVPADALSLNGTIVWEEIGKVPGES
jgi:hypothetical protein